MAFKQKSGSPFQRNFGIGKSPIKHEGRIVYDKESLEERAFPNEDTLKALEEYKKYTGGLQMKSPMKDTGEEKYRLNRKEGPPHNLVSYQPEDWERKLAINHNMEHQNNPDWDENHENLGEESKATALEMKSPMKTTEDTTHEHEDPNDPDKTITHYGTKEGGLQMKSPVKNYSMDWGGENKHNAAHAKYNAGKGPDPHGDEKNSPNEMKSPTKQVVVEGVPKTIKSSIGFLEDGDEEEKYMTNKEYYKKYPHLKPPKKDTMFSDVDKDGNVITRTLGKIGRGLGKIKLKGGGRGGYETGPGGGGGWRG